MKYGVHVPLVTSGDADLSECVEQVMEPWAALEECHERLLDFALGMDLSTGTVEAEITVEADAVEEAVSLAVSSLRSAIHASGGLTPDWDTIPTDTAVKSYILDETGLSARPLVDA